MTTPEIAAEQPYAPPAETGRVRDRAATWARGATLALLAILLLAAALRFWGLTRDLPFSFHGDELHFMKRSIALGTGDLNPHWFHKPALLMYVLAFCYGLYYAAGLALGLFHSTEQFGAHFLFQPGPFILIGRLVVLLCGVATVYVTYHIGRRAFGRVSAGLAAALVAAVLAPMTATSSVIKSDVTCGLLMALSIYAYLGVREGPGLRPLIAASLLAGAAMGTHYYGIVLVPTFLAMELLRAFSQRAPWRARVLGAVRRGALVAALFTAGFFLTSPYNFLDPTWGRATARELQHAFGLGGRGGTGGEEAEIRFEPDHKVEYRPGAEAWGGAALAFLRVLVDRRAMSLPLALLAGIGLAAALARRETRWYGLLVLVPSLFFFLGAITVAAYHTQPRHLNALYPLLATLVGPGALALVGRVPPLRPRPRATAAAALLVAAACLPTLAETARYAREISRLDSRVVAYRWILRHLPRDARLLVDDYGPILNPDRRAAARLHAELDRLGEGPFTHHQDLRIRLIERYPPPDGRDLDELGHQWWVAREKTDAELRSSPVDLDMGNPLVSRQPRSLGEYRARGIRYVITNSSARDRYFVSPGRERDFPSFARFYRQLGGLRPIETFDPAAWGGKGPVVWIYDLAPAPPRQTRDLRPREDDRS